MKPKFLVFNKVLSLLLTVLYFVENIKKGYVFEVISNMLCEPQGLWLFTSVHGLRPATMSSEV